MKREVESGSVVLFSSYIILDNDYTNIIVKNHARRVIYCFMIFNRERQIFASISSKYERIIIVGKLNIKIEIENCIQEPYQISAASFVMPERILLLQEESEA